MTRLFVTIDSPHKPSDALKRKAEVEKRGPLRDLPSASRA
jgi:hypothetical protein